MQLFGRINASDKFSFVIQKKNKDQIFSSLEKLLTLINYKESNQISECFGVFNLTSPQKKNKYKATIPPDV